NAASHPCFINHQDTKTPRRRTRIRRLGVLVSWWLRRPPTAPQRCAPAAAARGEDAYTIPDADWSRDLTGQLHHASAAPQLVATGLRGSPAGSAERARAAALGQQGELRGGEELELADDAVAAAMATATAGVRAHRVAPHAHG